MIESLLYAMLDILRFVIIGMSLVVLVWAIALVTIVAENRLKKWGKGNR